MSKQPTGVNRKFTCSKCGQTKTSRMFPKDPRTKKGYQGRCRACAAAHNKVYQQKHSGDPITRSRFHIFMSNVVRGEGDCWGWTGHRKIRDGRPLFRDKVKRVAARWIAEYFWGPAPIDEDGQPYDAHHVCLTDDCLNPAHIRWVSKARHREIHAELKRLGEAAA